VLVLTTAHTTDHNIRSQAASLRGMVWVKNPPPPTIEPLRTIHQPLTSPLIHTSNSGSTSSTDAAPTSNVPSTALVNVNNSVNSSVNNSVNGSTSVHSSIVKSSSSSSSSSTGWSLQGTSGMTKDDAAAADTVARAQLLQASLMSGGGARSALDKRWRAMTGSSLLQPCKLPVTTGTGTTGSSGSKSAA
jgi:hypothetical protein